MRHTGEVSYLRELPALYYFTVVIGLLALWSNDIRGVYIAGVCFLVGTVQYALGADPDTAHLLGGPPGRPDDDELEP